MPSLKVLGVESGGGVEEEEGRRRSGAEGQGSGEADKKVEEPVVNGRYRICLSACYVILLISYPLSRHTARG